MLRVIVRTVDSGAAANVGGPVIERFSTIDIDAPEVEQALTSSGAYQDVQVIGVEVLPKDPEPGTLEYALDVLDGTDARRQLNRERSEG